MEDPSRKDEITLYIEKSEAFARPVLSHLRQLVHKVCPEVTETLKWGFPHFMYRKTILCSMASFKNHCAFGFWLASKMKDPSGIMQKDETRSAMGDLGKIRSLADLPSKDRLRELTLEAMALIEKGVRIEKKPATPSGEILIPEDLQKALMEAGNAYSFFEELSPGQKKEYLIWISEAKTQSTRATRISTTAEWCSEGKRRNWKYESKKAKA